ncbi:hypothetical protein EC991_003769 [Linnemannia zychae]|nr:hypothetical protein EC991_003769 [Linnemannia zychae]
MVLDSGSDWESEQLRTLLNLSDQDMDLFQVHDDGLHAPITADDTLVTPSMVATGGQTMMMQSGFLSQQHDQPRQHNVGDSITSRRHSTPSYMTPTIPPQLLPMGEIKRPDTKEAFVHPGFYSLSSSSQQPPQRPSLQQQQSQSHTQGAPAKTAMKRAFQEDDVLCPTTASSHRHNYSRSPLQGIVDPRRHSVDGCHVAAKAASAGFTGTNTNGGGSTSPAPPHAWAYSTPPKTPNSLPAPKFHPHAPHPHARASTADYSQVPPGQPYMATNHIASSSPSMSAASPASSSPFQPTAHFTRSLSSPAGTKLSSATGAFAFCSSPTTISGTGSGSSSSSGTPRKRRGSKFRIDNSNMSQTNSGLNGGMIPFDPTALLSHFGLVNTLPPPLQQQHPSSQTSSQLAGGFLFHQPQQSEHAMLFQQQQQQQLQAALRRQQQQQQQHQQFAAAAAAAIGAAGGARGGSNSIAGQNAHAFLMQHLIADPRLTAAAAAAATPHTSNNGNNKQTTATAGASTYRRNPGEVPSSTLPPDHFIFQEALLTRNRRQAAQQHAQQQQQAQQAQQAKAQAQAQSQGGGGRARSNSISPTTGTLDGHSTGLSVASRRRSEPVSLYQLHQQRLLQSQQQQQKLQQQQQQQQQQTRPKSEQSHPSKHHQHAQQPQFQQHPNHQHQHLAMVVEMNSPYVSPISEQSSSSSSSTSSPSSTSVSESAIPSGPITTPSSTTTTVGVIASSAEEVIDFDMSSIINATEAVEAGTSTTCTTSTGVSPLTPTQEKEEEEKAAVGAKGSDADVEMSLTSSVENIEPKTKCSKQDKDEPLQEEEFKVTVKEETESKPDLVERDVEEEEEEEKEEREEEEEVEEVDEALSAAEAFTKSLTALTTTLDPAATQLMYQLRLQDYLQASTPIPSGTPSSSTVFGSKK